MVKINTSSIKKMLNKAIKVCSFDSYSPLTMLCELKIEDGYLHITTTDTRTNFQIKEKIDSEESLRVVVDVQLLTNLINKITTTEVGFKIDKNALVVEGNGIYFLDLRIDESGEIIKFPVINKPDDDGIDLDFKEFTNKLEIAKSSIPSNFDAKEMNNYYVSKEIIATDAFKVSSIPNLDSLGNMQLFISRDLGNILMALGIEKGKLHYNQETNELTICDSNYIIQSVIGMDMDKYPLDAIKSMLESSFKYNVVVNKKDILDILDRAMLFVRDFERNCILLTFKSDKLGITSLEETMVEDIKYIKSEVNDLTEFSASVDIKNLKDQLDVLPENEITIYFGDNDRAIKMVQNNIIQLTALIED